MRTMPTNNPVLRADWGNGVLPSSSGIEGNIAIQNSTDCKKNKNKKNKKTIHSESRMFANFFRIIQILFIILVETKVVASK